MQIHRVSRHVGRHSNRGIYRGLIVDGSYVTHIRGRVSPASRGRRTGVETATQLSVRVRHGLSSLIIARPESFYNRPHPDKSVIAITPLAGPFFIPPALMPLTCPPSRDNLLILSRVPLFRGHAANRRPCLRGAASFRGRR